MARIKPQTLLLQSKKKKGPARISAAKIMFCSLLVALVVFSLYATHRHWISRSRNQTERDVSTFEDNDDVVDSKYDLPGYAVLSTSKGSITVELFKDGSPEIVDKFLDMCQKDQFKGMLFHHVIKNYVIQAGESQGLKEAEDWTSKLKFNSQLATSPKHEAFMLGVPKTTQDSKRFELLITTAPIPDLSDKLIVFGQVVKGEDVVQEIEEVDTDDHYRPKSPIEIINVTLQRQI